MSDTPQIEAQPAPDQHLRVLRALILFVLMLVAWHFRSRNPLYTTAFEDESVLILFGRFFFAHPLGTLSERPLMANFGWYLWPIMAATADKIAGLAGVRLLAAFFGTAVLLPLYGFASRVFSPRVGLASAAVFTLLTPAISAARLGTYESSALFFFTMGLWLYVRAWQEEKNGAWAGAAACFFAAFLCKYVVAPFFPLLVLLSLKKGRKPLFFFCLPLAVICATYGLLFYEDLVQLLKGIAQYDMAHGASRAQVWDFYVKQRKDFWILLVLSLLVLIPLKRPSNDSSGDLSETNRFGSGSRLWVAACLWLGTFVVFWHQLQASAAAFRFPKHVNYSFLFLVPLAMHGVLRLVDLAGNKRGPWLSAATVALLAFFLGWPGHPWRPEYFVFWPNLEPVLWYFDGRLQPQMRVLADDVSLKYYFSPVIDPMQVSDAYYFVYGGKRGAAAYQAAVRDGAFDYIVLHGGTDGANLWLQDVLRPVLADRYSLRFNRPDPLRHQRVLVYERVNPPVAVFPMTGPHVEIISPAEGEVVQTVNAAAQLQGRVSGFETGWYVRMDVFTDKWYPQDGKVTPDLATGSFSSTIFLGSRCDHIVRARLFDENGKQLASATHFGIARANPDGSAPDCPK